MEIAQIVIISILFVIYVFNLVIKLYPLCVYPDLYYKKHQKLIEEKNIKWNDRTIKILKFEVGFMLTAIFSISTWVFGFYIWTF